MTKSIHWLLIMTIAAVLVAGTVTIGPIAFADEDKGGKAGTPLSFRWNPDDTSSDPNNLIVVNAAFTRIGLNSDSTSDVQAELEGILKDKTKNESSTTVTTSVGTTTISTTVEAQAQKAGKLKGTITIDGEEYSVKFKASGDATILEVTEEFAGPTFSQSLTQEKLTISGTMKMCTEDKKCFKGFGVIKRESSMTTSGSTSITFTTDLLEAEVIGDSGFFKLTMNKLQRTIEVLAP